MTAVVDITPIEQLPRCVTRKVRMWLWKAAHAGADMFGKSHMI